MRQRACSVDQRMRGRLDTPRRPRQSPSAAGRRWRPRTCGFVEHEPLDTVGSRSDARCQRARSSSKFTVSLHASPHRTPEQIADALADWQQRGIDGINVMNWTIPQSYEEFVDHVVPELQARGLARTEYERGTLRSRLSGTDRLPDRHPAARFRKVHA